MPINKMSDDFVWGVATASYQVEGAYNEGGRGMSIWDTFSKTEGKVRHGHTGDTSCDQYHRYKEDVKLMKELGVKSYRFSIAWPRIFPKSMDDKPNREGLLYYHKLIDELKANGIKCAVTLYHWDLPQYLEDKGGWLSRDTATAFEKYAQTCFAEYGNKVDMWITLNEPWCSSYLGYTTGHHAPGHTSAQEGLTAAHHLNLAHGLAVKKFREGKYSGQIGITLNLGMARNATNDPKDIEAADRARDYDSRIFTSPLFKGEYPKRCLEARKITVPLQDGDLQIIKQPIDFLGINYYSEEVVRYDENAPEKFSFCYKPHNYHPFFINGTWQDQPMGLYRILAWTKAEIGNIPLYITENGYGTTVEEDKLSEMESRCHDLHRINYMDGHLKAIKKAVDDGINLKGYFAWSFIDNYEWAHGYTLRFGIVYCDFNDFRRIPKDSYYYYRDVIAGHVDLGKYN